MFSLLPWFIWGHFVRSQAIQTVSLFSSRLPKKPSQIELGFPITPHPPYCGTQNFTIWWSCQGPSMIGYDACFLPIFKIPLWCPWLLFALKKFNHSIQDLWTEAHRWPYRHVQSSLFVQCSDWPGDSSQLLAERLEISRSHYSARQASARLRDPRHHQPATHLCSPSPPMAQASEPAPAPTPALEPMQISRAHRTPQKRTRCSPGHRIQNCPVKAKAPQ